MHENALKRQLEKAKETIQTLESELKETHEELQKTTSELLQLTLDMDDRVAERTEALRKSEEEVRRHRDHLQELVKQRPSEIEGVNQELELKLKELSASEERFRSLMMTIPDIVYRIDEEGKFTFVNDAIQKLDYHPKELIGKHFNEIMLPQDARDFSRNIVLPKYAGQKTGDKDAPKLFDERRSGERKTTGMEVRLVVKGGQRTEPGLVQPIGENMVSVEVSSSGIWEINPAAKERKFIGTVGVIRDITDRKQAENALKVRTTELQVIVNAMSGREVRMAQLKETIRKLRAQIESEGLTPVADDPLKEMGSVKRDE